ncbi:MAG: ATP-binding cassette domain-containing protein, partial [Prosthecobacter sp.]
MSLLSVQGLQVHFPVRGGLLGRTRELIKAVDDVSFEVKQGSTVGLVGESGSGKSTIARVIMKLLPPTAGTILFRDRSILSMSEKEFRPLRKDVQMVFQDPVGSLNPKMTVESILGEPLEIHFPKLNREERREKSIAMLRRVGLSADGLQHYPHEFSGGQRQRIGIARALAVEPNFLICDEPVS